MRKNVAPCWTASASLAKGVIVDPHDTAGTERLARYLG
jgi:hypothetical protein